MMVCSDIYSRPKLLKLFYLLSY